MSLPIHLAVIQARRRSEGGGGGDDVLKDSQAQAKTSLEKFASASDRKYLAGMFTAGSSYTLTRVDVPLKKSNSPTATVTCAIYNVSADTPTSLRGTATTTLDSSTLTGSYVDVRFDFAGVSVVSGTKYFVVLISTATDGTNNMDWASISDAGVVHKSADGSAWTRVWAPTMALKTFGH